MPKYPIDRRKSALIVYDMTCSILGAGSSGEALLQAEQIVPRLAALIAGCRNEGLPVIFVRQVLKEDGSDAGRLDDIYPGMRFSRNDPGAQIHPGLGMRPSDWLIEKNRFHAFWGTDLHERLQQRGIDTLIITGCSTAVGCETTAREATTRDFKVIFTADGTITRPLADIGWGAFPADEVHRLTLTVMGHSFARVASTSEVLAEIATH